MFGKRGVIQADATKRNTETSFRDPGAMSGLLTGVSFIVREALRYAAEAVREREIPLV